MNTVAPLLDLIDLLINQYVFVVYNRLDDTIVDLWRAGFILFLAIFGYRTAISGQMNPTELMTNTVKMMFIFMIATQSANFAFFVNNLVTQFPNELSSILLEGNTNSVNGSGTEQSSVGTNAALGRFFDDGFRAAGLVALQGGTFNPLPYLYSVVIMLGTVALTGIALILLIIAKVFVAVLLAVGPIFMLCLLFPTTRGFFEGWMRALFNYALVPVFTYAVLALILRMLANPIAGLITGSQGGAANFLAFLGTFLLIAFIGVVVLSQVPNMAASVTGGFALQTQNVARRLANRTANGLNNARQGFLDRFRGGPGARPPRRLEGPGGRGQGGGPQPRARQVSGGGQRADSPSGAAGVPGAA